MDLNHEQYEVIFCRKPQQVVIAGPGSGKTRTLCAKIENLLREQTDPRRIFVVTFTNAAAGEIIRRLPEGSSLGYCGTLHGLMLRMAIANGSNIAVADEDHAELVLRKVIKELRYKGTMEDAREEIRKELPIKSRYTDSERVAIAYFAELNGAGLVDFDGILTMGLKLIREWKNPERIEWLFVDEAQDCADIDFNIFAAMRIPHKLFIGDPDQAIYSFRGGNVTNFLRMANDLPATMLRAEESQIFTLSRNYRCRSVICHRAQLLIEHNSERFPKETVADEMGGEVEVTAFGHPFEELGFICNRIREGKLDIGRECALLYRTNHLAKQAADYLSNAGIRVARKTTERLPEDWFRARTAINLLNNPENDTLARLYLTLTVGEKEADTIHFDALTAYKSINQHHLHWPTRPISILEIGLSTIPEFLIKQKLSMESVSLVRSTIKKLPPGAAIFDLAVSLGADLHHLEEVGEGVTVTTMHSAKGREWSVVFLPAFEAGTIPSNSRRSKFWDKSFSAIEEERRLAYVAMTRAKDLLSFSYCDMRQGEFDRAPIKRKPSPYLLEAGLLA